MLTIRILVRWHLVPALLGLFVMVCGAVNLWLYEPSPPNLDALMAPVIPYRLLAWLAVVIGAGVFAKAYFDARRMSRGR